MNQPTKDIFSAFRKGVVTLTIVNIMQTVFLFIHKDFVNGSWALICVVIINLIVWLFYIFYKGDME